MINSEIKSELSKMITIAAWIARTGDPEQALDLKNAVDSIRRILCDHSEGGYEHLYMSGRVNKCRCCGVNLSSEETNV